MNSRLLLGSGRVGCAGRIGLLAVALTALPAIGLAEPSAKPAREQLAALEKDPNATAAKDLVARARAAFTRADRLRGVGDAMRAKLVESTAETWTAAATALTDLAQSRKRAEATEQKAHDTEESLSRARAALEASFAREQSLRDEADKAVKPKGPSPETKTAAAPKDGAAPKPKPAPKPAPNGAKP